MGFVVESGGNAARHQRLGMPRCSSTPWIGAMSWDETCSLCNNSTRWWKSRSGYLVCAICHPDVLFALETLARRGRPGLVEHVQGWWGSLPE
jgi:hypothetical protein